MTRKRFKARVAPHPRNRYAEAAPDFAELAKNYPSFRQYVRLNREGRGNIDWTDYNATRDLTRILLENDYGVKWWIPDGQLCPTVTNRANYIHWIEDLLGEFPAPGKKNPGLVTGVDIGTGASCIYPLLGASLHGWKFLGTDITEVALTWARKNIEENPHLQGLIKIRNAAGEESSSSSEGGGERILVGVLEDGEEEFDFCMCNPPFFESMEEAGLNPRTACGGTEREMVCPGGEAGFVSRLIEDSVQLGARIHWYTTMVGKKASLKALSAQLRGSGATMLKTTEFVQGRTSRWGLAWTFNATPTRNPSSVVRGGGRGNDGGNFSFMLDGMKRGSSAAEVLQGLASHLEAGGATCLVDTASFMISGTFPGDDHVLGKRNRDDVLVVQQQTSSPGLDRDDNKLDELQFKATLFQQSPGCLLVKGSVLRGRGASNRLMSVLEGAEVELRERFSSRGREKL